MSKSSESADIYVPVTLRVNLSLLKWSTSCSTQLFQFTFRNFVTWVFTFRVEIMGSFLPSSSGARGLEPVQKQQQLQTVHVYLRFFPRGKFLSLRTGKCIPLEWLSPLISWWLPPRMLRFLVTVFYIDGAHTHTLIEFWIPSAAPNQDL